MIASIPYPRALGVLLGVTVLVACEQLNTAPQAVMTKKLFGAYHDQFPPVVLSVDSKGPIDYLVDLNTTTIAGVPIADIIPPAKFWRLNAYRFADGKPASKLNPFQPIDETTVTLTGLKTETLMRVDIDLADDKQKPKKQVTYNFIVLLHNE
jgi:hypothetical protein